MPNRDYRRLSLRVRAQPPATKGCDCDKRFIVTLRFGALELRAEMNPAERLELAEMIVKGSGKIDLRAEMETLGRSILNATDLGAEKLPQIEGGPARHLSPSEP